jgi:3-deoxy-manno-octulosonate cytidylyltransferase (CMP-KDO synthetase)
MFALYMSRTPIPYPYKSVTFPYHKHIGILGYNKLALDFYKETAPGKFEQIEGIDTLRFLDYGKKLLFIPVDSCESLSVDTAKDLDIVREAIRRKQHV